MIQQQEEPNEHQRDAEKDQCRHRDGIPNAMSKLRGKDFDIGIVKLDLVRNRRCRDASPEEHERRDTDSETKCDDFSDPVLDHEPCNERRQDHADERESPGSQRQLIGELHRGVVAVNLHGWMLQVLRHGRDSGIDVVHCLGEFEDNRTKINDNLLTSVDCVVGGEKVSLHERLGRGILHYPLNRSDQCVAMGEKCWSLSVSSILSQLIDQFCREGMGALW